MTITRTLATAAQADSLLQRAVQEAYGKPLTVEIGFNRKRAQWASIAPFAVFFPAATSLLDGGSRLHTVALLLGTADSTVRAADSIPTLHGLDWLAQTALPHILRAMSDAVPGVLENCALQEPEVEYSQDDFPLVYCTAALTVIETLPIGSRRR